MLSWLVKKIPAQSVGVFFAQSLIFVNGCVIIVEKVAKGGTDGERKQNHNADVKSRV